MEHDNFGQLVRSLRTKKELGLRELARKLEISPAYLSRIESGDSDPPAPTKIEALARELGVSSELLFRAAERYPEDVKDMIKARPERVILLLRRTKHLTDVQIEHLLEDIRGRDSKNQG